MKTKPEIVAIWLPRYPGTPLKEFGKHILLVNFNNLRPLLRQVSQTVPWAAFG